MPITRDLTDLVEELRLPAGGSFIVTGPTGHELFRVTAVGSDPLLVEGVAPAGGVQTVSLLGPFTVNWDSIGLDSFGGGPVTLGNGAHVQLCAIPDGALILGAFVESTVPFVTDPPGAVDLNVAIQPEDNPDLASPILNPFRVSSSLDTTAPTIYTINLSFQTGSIVDANYKSTARAISGAFASVAAAFSGAVTAGACEVSILIATPS